MRVIEDLLNNLRLQHDQKFSRLLDVQVKSRVLKKRTVVKLAEVF